MPVKAGVYCGIMAHALTPTCIEKLANSVSYSLMNHEPYFLELM
jgi:hypothetical protein